MCLQEVDRFDSLLQKLSRDFDGQCAMKPDNIMGCAIFWRKAVVTKLSDVTSVVFTDEKSEKSNQIFAYAKFKKGTDEFYVVNTHLKAKKGFAETRKAQVD